MEPPEIFSVKPLLGIKRMVQIKWIRPALAPVSSALKYTLRFRTVNSAYWVSYPITIFLLEGPKKRMIGNFFLTGSNLFSIFYLKNRRQRIVSTFLPIFPFGTFRLDKYFTIGILHLKHRGILKSEKLTFAFHYGLCIAVLVARDSVGCPFTFFFSNCL